MNSGLAKVCLAALVLLGVQAAEATPMGEALGIETDGAAADYKCSPADPGAYPTHVLDEYGNSVGVDWYCPDPVSTSTSTTQAPPPPPQSTTQAPTTTTVREMLADSDGDGVPDVVEELWGSDPESENTDGDGSSDGDEVGDELLDLLPEYVDEFDAFEESAVIDLLVDTDGDGKP